MPNPSRRHEERGYGDYKPLPNPMYIVAPARDGSRLEKPDPRGQMVKVYGVRNSSGLVYDKANKYQPQPRLRDPERLKVFHSLEVAESDFIQANLDFPCEEFHVFQFVPERDESYLYPPLPS
jgi:hypothetical protein